MGMALRLLLTGLAMQQTQLAISSWTSSKTKTMRVVILVLLVPAVHVRVLYSNTETTTFSFSGCNRTVYWHVYLEQISFLQTTYPFCTSFRDPEPLRVLIVATLR